MNGDGRLIVDAMSDDEVIELLSQEPNRRLPAHLQGDLDRFVSAMQQQPAGLRAMAATYQLDVSLALDDLGWHFANWHHHGYYLETARGLRELGATRAAELVDVAYGLAVRVWDKLGSDDFVTWYHGSELEVALEPANQEMWAMYQAAGGLGLLKLWVEYARRHPDLLRQEGGAAEQGDEADER